MQQPVSVHSAHESVSEGSIYVNHSLHSLMEEANQNSHLNTCTCTHSRTRARTHRLNMHIEHKTWMQSKDVTSGNSRHNSMHIYLLLQLHTMQKKWHSWHCIKCAGTPFSILMNIQVPDLKFLCSYVRNQFNCCELSYPTFSHYLHGPGICISRLLNLHISMHSWRQ